MKIFLNAGHGGADPGAVGKTGLKEKDITLKIATILKKRLEANYYPVEMYQQEKSVYEVSTKANNTHCTLFISIHCNAAASPEANGVEVLYQSTKGEKRAKIIQEELIKSTKLKNRGIKLRNDLHVLNRTKAPAVLVETAFISNPKEEKLLNEQPEIFANGIWEAIKIMNKNGLLYQV